MFSEHQMIWLVLFYLIDEKVVPSIFELVVNTPLKDHKIVEGTLIKIQLSLFLNFLICIFTYTNFHCRMGLYFCRMVWQYPRSLSSKIAVGLLPLLYQYNKIKALRTEHIYREMFEKGQIFHKIQQVARDQRKPVYYVQNS